MYQFVLVIHMLVSVSIIMLVLVQQGKGATMGAAFGSGASQTVFGSRGSGSFLLKLTAFFVVIFFATSITLNHMVVQSTKQETMIPVPAMPSGIPSTPAPNTQPSNKV